jgi:hypothetical protein
MFFRDEKKKKRQKEKKKERKKEKKKERKKERKRNMKSSIVQKGNFSPIFKRVLYHTNLSY